MSDNELAELRRDVGKLGIELGRGMSAASILIEQTKGSLAEFGRRFDQKVRDDHGAEVELARDLGEIRAKVEAIERSLHSLSGLPALIARLEAWQDHLKGDVTGKHSIERLHVEAGAKKEDREVEKVKIASDERKAKLQFWGAIAVVALPGMLAMVWHLFGFAGSPPTIPGEHQDQPSIAAPPHHE